MQYSPKEKRVGPKYQRDLEGYLQLVIKIKRYYSESITLEFYNLCEMNTNSDWMEDKGNKNPCTHQSTSRESMKQTESIDQIPFALLH